MDSPKHAIVIGAGIAGLASSIRLAAQGFQVDVFEKNAYPGGKLSHFSKEGFQFDAGPSLFTQPENIAELFALAGEPMEPYFQFETLPVSFNYFYEDGTVIHAYTDNQLFASELEQKTGEPSARLLNYLKGSRKIYQQIAGIFLNHSLHQLSTLFNANIPAAIRAFRWKYIFKTMHQLNVAQFSDPRIIQLFDRYATYNGSNPYQAPGMLTLIPHLELNQGTFYPKGGMISITNALYQLACKMGVRFHFNHAVERIIVDGKSVQGVVSNQQTFLAPVVVSNMDVYFTYQKLLSDNRMAAHVLKQERSSSALIFYWGIKKEFATLGLHNIFFSQDYKAEFDALFGSKTCYADPTIYINITSKMEPGIQAPAGKENWFVMVNAPANTGQDWEDFKRNYRAAVIQKLNRMLGVDLESLIELEEILDPVLIESKTDSYQGSLYGTSSNDAMAAFLRHPNFSKQLKGLYFVGGSVHPGGGIPLCLKSASIMSKMVANEFN